MVKEQHVKECIPCTVQTECLYKFILYKLHEKLPNKVVGPTPHMYIHTSTCISAQVVGNSFDLGTSHITIKTSVMHIYTNHPCIYALLVGYKSTHLL